MPGVTHWHSPKVVQLALTSLRVIRLTNFFFFSCCGSSSTLTFQLQILTPRLSPICSPVRLPALASHGSRRRLAQSLRLRCSTGWGRCSTCRVSFWRAQAAKAVESFRARPVRQRSSLFSAPRPKQCSAWKLKILNGMTTPSSRSWLRTAQVNWLAKQSCTTLNSIRCCVDFRSSTQLGWARRTSRWY